MVTVHDHVSIPRVTEDHDRKIEDKPGLKTYLDFKYFKSR